MQCIDFDDHEPGMDTPDGNTLARCEYFQVDKLALEAGASIANPNPERFTIVTVVSGELESAGGERHQPGQFLLVPRGGAPLTARSAAIVLQTSIPK